MKKYGRRKNVVTDGLCSYPAAMRERSGDADRHDVAVGSTTARKLASSPFDDEYEPSSGFEARRHCRNSAQFMLQVQHHFNLERHLVTREIYKQRRSSAALAEWRVVMA